MMETGNVAMIHCSLAYLVNDPLARCGAPSTPNDASAAITRLRGAGNKVAETFFYGRIDRPLCGVIDSGTAKRRFPF